MSLPLAILRQPYSIASVEDEHGASRIEGLFSELFRQLGNVTTELNALGVRVTSLEARMTAAEATLVDHEARLDAHGI